MKATKLRKLLAFTSAVAMLLSGLSTTALASTSDTGNEVFYPMEADCDEAMDYGIAQDTLLEDEVYFEDTEYDYGIEQEAGEGTYVDDFIVIDDDPVSSTAEDYVEQDYNENSDEENGDYEAPDSYEAGVKEAPDDEEIEETDEGIFENDTADEVFTEEFLVGDSQDAYTGNLSPINLQLKAAKALSVKAGFSVENNPGTFTFKLTPMDASRAGDADTQSITGYGNVTFKVLTFNTPGEYVYEITELNTGAPGYIYDKSVYTATVRVLQENNYLQASVSYVKTDEDGVTSDANSIKFTNRYAPEPLVEKIRVSNTVTGKSEGNNTFKFTLTRAANNAKVDEVTITGNGTATFKELGYGSPGTYTYRVTEEAGSAGYVYDTSVYTVRIVLTDNNGVLEKTVTYSKNNNSSYTSADFTNVFVRGAFTFYAARSDSQNKGVNGAVFEIYGIKETDRSSTAYKTTANAFSGGSVNYKSLTRIASGTSGSNGKVVFNSLLTNTFYVIKMTSAPKGYQLSRNPIIIHTFYSNGKFGVTMTSSGYGTATREPKTGLCKWLIHRVKVVINIKKSNGELLAGAKLRLIDTSTGNPVEAWTSKSTSGHEIVVKLQTGRSYRVVETAAPKGFQKASDTNFMVKAHPVANEEYVQTINIVHKAVVTVKSVKFGKSAYTVKKGKKLQLKAVITPSNATNRKITWKSGNTKIVKVSSTGKITGIKKGTTTVTATASNGKKATCRVTVS